MAIFYWLLYGLKWKCWRIYNFCCNLFWVYGSIDWTIRKAFYYEHIDIKNTTDVYKSYRHVPHIMSWCSLCMLIKAGVDPRFQVRGCALKKIASSGGRREKFWGISCEKSRFYANFFIFSNFRGARAGCAPLWIRPWKGVHDVWLLTRQYHEYWWSSFQHFKVPVFREILPPSEQYRMIKTPSSHTKFWMNISRSIYI